MPAIVLNESNSAILFKAEPQIEQKENYSVAIDLSFAASKAASVEKV